MTDLSQALEFRCKFRQPFLVPGAQLTVGDVSRLGMQLGLIEEEGNEFKEAVLAWVDAPSREAKAHALKELADLVYVCYQMAAFLSVDLDEAFDRVHASNMSKLDDNGKPIYNASGKVMKGPNYKEPDLSDLV
jgi:predicted HAD superfamily Cof-like phosphohydrolase